MAVAPGPRALALALRAGALGAKRLSGAKLEQGVASDGEEGGEPGNLRGALVRKLLGNGGRRTLSAPLFHGPAPVEGPNRYGAAYKHNRRWATPSETGWQTQLKPGEEQRFLHWLHTHNDPGGFNPNANRVDYDMRGYWKSTHGTPQEYKGAGHLPDTFKTPYDTTFSDESKYAKPGTPFVWRTNAKGENVLVNKRNGRVIVRESEQ